MYNHFQFQILNATFYTSDQGKPQRYIYINHSKDATKYYTSVHSGKTVCIKQPQHYDPGPKSLIYYNNGQHKY